MKSITSIIGALGLIVPLALGLTAASAEDQLKLAIGQINNWENQPPTLGQDAGIFKKHGLVLENVGTQGAGETIQAVISGSADIGAGVGAAGVMRAFSKGAPVRILAPAFTGTGDLYWYVKSDSKIQSLKDATADNTIAYSTNGSSSNNIVVAFASELGLKAKPTATGGPPGTLTGVMSGQIDIGWRRRLSVSRKSTRAKFASSRAAAMSRRCAGRRCASFWSTPNPGRPSAQPSNASWKATARRLTGCMPIRRRSRCIRSR